MCVRYPNLHTHSLRVSVCVCVCVGGGVGGVHTRKRLCVRRCYGFQCVSFAFASYDLVCVVLSKYV